MCRVTVEIGWDDLPPDVQAELKGPRGREFLKRYEQSVRDTVKRRLGLRSGDAVEVRFAFSLGG